MLQILQTHKTPNKDTNRKQNMKAQLFAICYVCVLFVIL